MSKNRFTKKYLIVLFVFLLILLAGGGVVAYKKNNDKKISDLKSENAKLSNPQEAAKKETEELKNKVASLIDVPSDETPTIATVVDVEKLKSQAFFAKAQNGDKVLMYQQAKKAILYRPSTNKIVEVAPLNIGNSSAKDQKQESTQPAQ